MGSLCYNCHERGHLARDCGLDIESKMSILPARVLMQAKRDGYDIDNEVMEHKIHMSKRVYDTSGSVMTFVTIVEIQETLLGGKRVLNQMYMTSADEDVVILRTNVLPHLGYKLVEGMMPSRKNSNEPETHVARIGQRIYVAPGSVKWV
ncbi:hypothetical protein Y032_0192g1355 [Ancylostoma ceylanicum]|uniref:CCHC-type domain-containing protein n=1 Tax=Ancylostoma ceylanicum TaxID=53326 RepID=A0A016SQD0_9BILA|nr:hypothetical protein Y032_0192g1355 [Ancylostoma ceylanicum]